MPLRSTDATVLIISHGAIISGLVKYFKYKNYRISDRIKRGFGELAQKTKHCSLSEVHLGPEGPGEIIRVGDCEHLSEIESSMDLEYMSRLDGRIVL